MTLAHLFVDLTHFIFYFFTVRQDPLLGSSEMFNSFLRKAQQVSKSVIQASYKLVEVWMYSSRRCHPERHRVEETWMLSEPYCERLSVCSFLCSHGLPPSFILSSSPVEIEGDLGDPHRDYSEIYVGFTSAIDFSAVLLKWTEAGSDTHWIRWCFSLILIVIRTRRIQQCTRW